MFSNPSMTLSHEEIEEFKNSPFDYCMSLLTMALIVFLQFLLICGGLLGLDVFDDENDVDQGSDDGSDVDDDGHESSDEGDGDDS